MNNIMETKSDPKIRKKYYNNGNIKTEKYFLNNQLHREDGPACIEYYEDGNKMIELHYLNNKCHKEIGLAIIWYCNNGKIKHEHYWISGKCHRSDGPAVIRYNEDGSIEEELYWEYGKEMDVLMEFEVKGKEGIVEGYTKNYIKVEVPCTSKDIRGKILTVKIEKAETNFAISKLI